MGTEQIAPRAYSKPQMADLGQYFYHVMECGESDEMICGDYGYHDFPNSKDLESAIVEMIRCCASHDKWCWF